MSFERLLFSAQPRREQRLNLGTAEAVTASRRRGRVGSFAFEEMEALLLKNGGFAFEEPGALLLKGGRICY